MMNIIEISTDGKIIEVITGGIIATGGGGGGGATNLAYTASPTNGIVTSDTGTDATIPSGSTTNASLMLPADKTKLDGVATGATANSTDAQLRDRTTHTGSQAISTVTGLQTALDGKQATGDYATNTALTNGLATKENTITAGTVSQYYRGDKTFQTLDKTAVGLANVDNTSDLNKPISTATQTALNAKQDTLISGTNIKTINSLSLLGSGNITISGGGGATDLAYVASSTNGVVTSSTGNSATIPAGSTTDASLMLPADKTKLNSITVDTATVVRKLVRNQTGSTIAKGTPVYQLGSSGIVMTVAPADASTEVTASQTLGITQEAIANNTNGYVVAVGLLDGLNTSALTEGQIVWLSETTGQLTTTRPTQPAHGVVCGYCVKQGSGASGILYVKVDNGLELNELHDVLLTGAVTGNVLALFADGLWKPLGLTKSSVSLSNVDNTSDANKPISTATQTALDAKQATITNSDSITQGSTNLFLTTGERTKLTNTSGTNTGDNATNSQYSGLATSKQDTLVSGTNIKTINSTSVLGSGDIVISGSGLTQQQVMRLAL